MTLPGPISFEDAMGGNNLLTAPPIAPPISWDESQTGAMRAHLLAENKAATPAPDANREEWIDWESQRYQIQGASKPDLQDALAPPTPLERALKYAGDRPTEQIEYWAPRVPFGRSGWEGAKLHDVWQAATRIDRTQDAGKEDTVYDDWLNGKKPGKGLADYSDYMTLARFFEENERLAGRSKLRQAGDIVTQLPAFGVEIFATAGAFTAGREVTKAGLKKLIAKVVKHEAGRKAAGAVLKTGAGKMAARTVAAVPQYAAGGMAMAAVNPQMVAEASMRSHVGSMDLGAGVHQDADGGLRFDIGVGRASEGDNFAASLLKGFGDTSIELGSEMAGGDLMRLTGAMASPLRKLPGASRVAAMKGAVAKRWLDRFPGSTKADLARKILKQGGWHGVIEEMLEERAGAVARSATGLQSWADAVPTLEQLQVEALAFSVPGAAAMGAQMLDGAGRPAVQPADVPQDAPVSPAALQPQPERPPSAIPPIEAVPEWVAGNQEAAQQVAEGQGTRKQFAVAFGVAQENTGRQADRVAFTKAVQAEVDRQDQAVGAMEQRITGDVARKRSTQLEREKAANPRNVPLSNEWQPLPPGVRAPENPAIEVRQDKNGTSVRLRTAEEMESAAQLRAERTRLEDMTLPQLNREGSKYGLKKTLKKTKRAEKIEQILDMRGQFEKTKGTGSKRFWKQPKPTPPKTVKQAKTVKRSEPAPEPVPELPEEITQYDEEGLRSLLETMGVKTAKRDTLEQLQQAAYDAIYGGKPRKEIKFPPPMQEPPAQVEPKKTAKKLRSRKSRVQRTVQSVKNDYGYDVAPREPQTPLERETVEWARDRGLDVQVVDGPERFNGAYSKDNEVLFIRGGRDVNPLWRTIGHEVAHGTGLDTKTIAGDELIEEYAKKYYDNASPAVRAQLDAGPGRRKREGIATLVGEFMADPKFRARLKQDKPTLYQQLRDAILKVMGRWTPKDDAASQVLEELRGQVRVEQAEKIEGGAKPLTVPEAANKWIKDNYGEYVRQLDEVRDTKNQFVGEWNDAIKQVLGGTSAERGGFTRSVRSKEDADQKLRFDEIYMRARDEYPMLLTGKDVDEENNLFENLQKGVLPKFTRNSEEVKAEVFERLQADITEERSDIANQPASVLETYQLDQDTVQGWSDEDWTGYRMLCEEIRGEMNDAMDASNSTLPRYTVNSGPVVAQAMELMSGPADTSFNVDAIDNELYFSEEPGPYQSTERPDWANFGFSDEARRFLDTQVDRVLKGQNRPRLLKSSEARAEADNRLRDYDRERKRLIRIAETTDQPPAPNWAGVMVSRDVYNQEVEKALESDNTDKLLAARKIGEANRSEGSVQGQALAGRHDPLSALQDAVMEGNADTSERIADAKRKAREKAGAGDQEGAGKQRAYAEKQRQKWLEQFNEERRKMAKWGWDYTKLGEYVRDPTKAAEFLRDLRATRSVVSDVMFELWRNSILSAAKTTSVDVTSSVAFAAWGMNVERALEGLLRFAAESTGIQVPGDMASLGEFKHVYKGAAPGIGRGVRNSLAALATETPQLQQQVGVRGSGEMTGRYGAGTRAIAGWPGRVVRLVGYTRLLVADEMIQTTIANMEVSALAYRRGLARGFKDARLDGFIRDEVADMESTSWILALKEARRYTFQNQVRSRVGKRVVDLAKQGARDIPGMRWLMPFISTPARIVETGLLDGPLAPVVFASMVYKARQTGNWDDVARQGVRAVIASGVMLALWLRFDDEDPWITGAAEEHDWRLRTGSQRSYKSQSIRMPWGTWYSYARIEPFSTGLSMMADTTAAWKKAMRGGLKGKAVFTPAVSAVNVVTSKSFLKGLGDVFAITRHQDKVSAAMQWGSNFAASFMPNELRHLVKQADNRFPQRRIWGKGSQRYQRLARRTVQKMEVFRGLVPDQPFHDIWGRTAPRGPAGSGPATDFMHYVLRNVTPMDAHVPDVFVGDLVRMRWNVLNPNTSTDTKREFHPQIALPKYEVDGKTRYMTDKQYAQFTKLAGTVARRLVETHEFDVANVTRADIALIEEELATAREITKRHLVKEWTKGVKAEDADALFRRIRRNQAKRFHRYDSDVTPPERKSGELTEDYQKRVAIWRNHRRQAKRFLRERA